MTVTLELPADIEAELLRQARARGLSLKVYLEQIVQNATPPTAKSRASNRKSLAQLFAESPFKGLEMDFPRDQDPYGQLICERVLSRYQRPFRNDTDPQLSYSS
jgi:hypothetical protein